MFASTRSSSHSSFVPTDFASSPDAGDAPRPVDERIIDRTLATLVDLAADPQRFDETLSASFGPHYDREAAAHLRSQLLSGDKSWMPTAELLSPQDLHGAKGAYAEGGAV